MTVSAQCAVHSLTTTPYVTDKMKNWHQGLQGRRNLGPIGLKWTHLNFGKIKVHIFREHFCLGYFSFDVTK